MWIFTISLWHESSRILPIDLGFFTFRIIRILERLVPVGQHHVHLRNGMSRQFFVYLRLVPPGILIVFEKFRLIRVFSFTLQHSAPRKRLVSFGLYQLWSFVIGSESRAIWLIHFCVLMRTIGLNSFFVGSYKFWKIRICS